MPDREYTSNEARVRQTVAQFHKNFNTREFEKNGELVSDDLRVTSNGKQIIGRDAFIKQIARFTTPFPDVEIVDLDTIVDGNKAAIRFVITGTHKGDLETPDGIVPPTNQAIKIDGIEYFVFNNDGKLVELVTVEDLAALAQQLKGRK